MTAPKVQSFSRTQFNWFGSLYPQASFPNGTTIRFQDDGNLVVYDKNGTAIAGSGVQNTDSTLNQLRLYFQDDGNFVAYGGSGEKSYWAADTSLTWNRAETIKLSQDAPYIWAEDANGTQIWDIVSTPRPTN